MTATPGALLIPVRMLERILVARLDTWKAR
jgi:hypothetical protein